MEILSNFLLVIFMTLIAIIAAMFEDLESDVASTSNPNSQVQLAPQIGNLHKLFNRAVSGEPLFVGAMATIAGSVCYCLIINNCNIILSLFISTIIATAVHTILSITSYTSRITSQSLYNQPLFVDMLYKHVPTMIAHAFISLFSILLLAYLMGYMLNPAVNLPLPLISLMLGISIGSIGSAIGDIHYGAEKLYQDSEFGVGVPISNNGNITTMDSLGSRNSIDVVAFTSKFAGPLTGLCFGLIIFLTFWLNLFGVVNALIISAVLIILFVLLNYYIERKSREKYGKYKRND